MCRLCLRMEVSSGVDLYSHDFVCVGGGASKLGWDFLNPL